MPFDKLRANGFELAAGRMDKTVRSEANFSVRGEPVEPLTLDRLRTDIRPSSFVLRLPGSRLPLPGQRPLPPHGHLPPMEGLLSSARQDTFAATAPCRPGHFSAKSSRGRTGKAHT